MRPSPPEPRTPDLSAPSDDVVVEATTAEEAIAEVHARLGEDAQILQADRVLRGGRWGFFQKQVVQLTARPAATSAPAEEVRRVPSVEERLAAAQRQAPAAPASAPAAAPETARGLDAVLAQLSAAEDGEELDLGSALRRHLGVEIEEDTHRPTPAAATPSAAPEVPASPSAGWRPPAASPTSHRLASVTDGEPTSTPMGIAAALATLEEPAPPAEEAADAALDPVARVGEEPAPRPVGVTSPRAEEQLLPLEDVEFSRASGTPWSGRGLLMLGLPRGFVDAVLAQDPVDDASWTYAVARSLAPLCRPLPTGPSVIVGPRAEKLAREVGVPLVRLTATPRGTSTFAVACTDSSRSRTWLSTHRGQRWTHLVVGGSGWRGLLFEGPLAVSWVGDDSLGDAIRTAHDLGMVLGTGVRDDAAGTVVEPAPIELAMLLRDMLGGRR